MSIGSKHQPNGKMFCVFFTVFIGAKELTAVDSFVIRDMGNPDLYK
jgi:hypothetical protein